MVLGNPRLFFRELLWRWCFGAVALAICAWLFSAPIHSTTKTISGLQITNLRSENAYVVAQTLQEILEQAFPKFTTGLLEAIPSLSILWLAAATAGHCFSFRLLGSGSKPNGKSTFVVHLFRVIWALFAVVAIAAAVGISALLTRRDPDNTNFTLYYISLAIAGLVIWSVSNVGNWYLTLAPLFTVVEGASVRGALRRSRQRSSGFAGPLAVTTMMFFFVRLVWFGAIGVFSMAPVALFDSSPGTAAVLLIALTLIYYAGADFLYIARMAAYWHVVRP